MQPGDIVGGKYVIERLLGQGGMGAVYLARQDRLDRKVAIKFLHAEGGASPEAHARFAREARAAAVLESEHVTRVLDVGHLDTDGAPYLVMEYLQGEDFAATLQRTGPLPVAKAIDAIVQACDAIGEAHARGIVHRDLKPANLFMARRANGTAIVKVLDFGISKAYGAAAGVALTSTSALVGSPLYMSPEQIREARTVDGRADVWALGVILYELLTGTTPFVSTAFGELCALIITSPPQPLRAHRPDVSPALEAIVARCLQKEAADRFATAGDLVAALRAAEQLPVGTPAPPFSAPQPPSASVSAPLVAAAAAARTGDGMSNTRVSSHPPRGRAAIAVVGAVMVVGATATLFLVRARPGPPTTVAAPSAVVLPSASELASVATAAPSTPDASPVASSASAPVVASALPSAPPRAPPSTTVAPPAPRKPPPSSAHAADAPPAPLPSKAPAVDCKVPYVFDANGNKHFKPECL